MSLTQVVRTIYLIDTCKEIFNYEYFIPTHQGRGAEKVLFPLLISKPGQYVLSNMHFDTTKAHVELANARAVDLVIQEAFDTSSFIPLKETLILKRWKSSLEKKVAKI